MQRRRATQEQPGSGGVLLSDPEDFFVEETLPYELTGEGRHLFAWVEKRGVTTPEAARALSAAWGTERPSWAGLKDLAAVARQWMSVPWPDSEPPPKPGPITASVHVLQVLRHPHRLKSGHVARNRFRIRLRQVPAGGFERAAAAAGRLGQLGLPNHFGPQRFGRTQDNAETARAILSGARARPRDRRLHKLMMSALQAQLFNQVLDRRLESDRWAKALAGDLMKKHATGGLFICEAPSVDQARLDALEISPTGPMFGKRMRAPTGEAAALEAEVWAAAGLDQEQRRRLGDGTRRPLRIPLALELEPEEDGYTVSFSLPSGSYGTIVLDELVKPADGVFDRTRATDSTK